MQVFRRVNKKIKINNPILLSQPSEQRFISNRVHLKSITDMEGPFFILNGKGESIKYIPIHIYLVTQQIGTQGTAASRQKFSLDS